MEWIRKMHSEGLLRPKNEDPETSQLVRDAANGMVETLDSSGPDAVEDWEVDELLEWTTALNFDELVFILSFSLTDEACTRCFWCHS